MAPDRRLAPSAPSLPNHSSVPGVPALQRGLAAQQAGRTDEAIRAFRRAVHQNPGLAPAHFNLGQLLRDQGDYAGATVCFEGAARLRPTVADAWLTLGAVLEKTGRFHDAVTAYQRAAECLPDDPAPTYQLGKTLMALGDIERAAAAFRTVIERQADHVDAHRDLATALLAAGNFGGGWKEYEWRWAKQGLGPTARFSWPVWNGEAVAGRRMLVWCEPGLASEILFATCVRELVALGALVTVAASARLVSLFARAFPGVEVVADGDWGEGPYHYHCPLGGLPKQLRRSRAAFLGSGKFLVPDSQHATRWANRLDRLGAGLKVGICAGAEAYPSLAAWQPLFDLSGIHWINLQPDASEVELVAASERFGIRIHRWKSEDLTNDLESVVGLLWNLDAVVTAPAVVSTLAGGAGTPTWQFDNGSDWTTHGEDRSPWFPSIQVVRRPAGMKDWTPVLHQIGAELSELRVKQEAVV